MQYVCDTARHLICVPYSIENLHAMAAELGINRCWFHKNHYDIPKKRIAEITAMCTLVTSKQIVNIIKQHEIKLQQ
jgi:FMN phosphatase YigB (HAD superfamily)